MIKWIILLNMLVSSVFATDTIRVALVFNDSAYDSYTGPNYVHGAFIVEDLQLLFDNDSVDAVARFAGMKGITYSEPGGYPQHLSRLQDATDGNFDDANVFRDQVQADVLVLIVKNADSEGIVGIVYGGAVDDGDNYWNDDYSMIVCKRTACVTSNVFVHEMAHLFGGAHGSEWPNGSPVFNDAYSHCSNSDSLGTILTFDHSWCPKKYNLVMTSHENYDYPGTSNARGTSLRDVRDHVAGQAPTIADFRGRDSTKTMITPITIEDNEFRDIVARDWIRFDTTWNIESGGLAYIHANDSIILGDGFHAKYGSSVAVYPIEISDPPAAKRGTGFYIPEPEPELVSGTVLKIDNQSINLDMTGDLTVKFFSIMGKEVASYQLTDDYQIKLPKRFPRVSYYQVDSESKRKVGQFVR